MVCVLERRCVFWLVEGVLPGRYAGLVLYGAELRGVTPGGGGGSRSCMYGDSVEIITIGPEGWFDKWREKIEFPPLLFWIC